MPQQQPEATPRAAPYAPARPTLGRTAAEFSAFIRPRPRFRPDPSLPRLDRRTVLVMPGLGCGDRQTDAVRAALDALGGRTFGWALGVNRGPTPATLAGMERCLLSLHARHGAVDVIGFSLGGVFARWLAQRHPEKVRQIMTVGSPFREVVGSAFIPLRPMLPLWRTPDLLRIAAEVAEPIPVPGTFVFSRNDGIVAWRSCVEPDQPEDCFEVSGPHVTLTHDSDVLAILAHRLARELRGRQEKPAR